MESDTSCFSCELEFLRDLLLGSSVFVSSAHTRHHVHSPSVRGTQSSPRPTAVGENSPVFCNFA